MLLDPALLQLKEKFESAKVRKEGMVRATDRSFGFLECGDKVSYFITPANMKNLLHGDKVSALIEQDDKGRMQAVPETLVESSLKRFVGRLTVTQDNGRTKYSVLPDNPGIKLQIPCDDKRKSKEDELKSGGFVVCSLKQHGLKDGRFRAIIDEFICRADDPQTPWKVSLRALDLPMQCPECPKDLTFHGNEADYADLTDLPFVTIDSAKTEDMDDALYLKKEQDKFILYVAIADPTAYIEEGSELDKEAALRSFSIYLPGRNIPMLPRELSDDLCSLREGQKRPALVAMIPVGLDGKIDCPNTKFMLAAIKSAGKLIYNEVSDFMEKGSCETFAPSEEVKQVLADLKDFTMARDQYRRAHSGIFRNRPDYEFVLDEAGALDHIEVNFRRIANQIVEESMITANVACGTILKERYGTGIFNTHKGFDLKETPAILELLKQEGYEGATSESIKSLEGFSAIRRYATSLESEYLDLRIRKLQEYSQVSLTPAPHFALGVEYYATWTSPIRKYGDMVNHRLLKAMILNQESPKLPDDEIMTMMNVARRTNRLVERDVRDWLYADYLQKDLKEGTVFKAQIFDVVRGGLRVSLDDNGAMIFVPSSLMAAERQSLDFNLDEGKVFVGGQCVLRLGDSISVRIAEINKAYRSIVGTVTESVGGLMLPDVQKVQASRQG